MMLTVIIFLGLIGAIVAVVYYAVRSNGNGSLSIPRDRVDEVTSYFKRVNETKTIPTRDVQILLQPGELGYLQEAVTLFEIKSIRENERLGGAVRVMKGVYIGGSKGQSWSKDKISGIDSGVLVLTNRRLVFSGVNQSRETSLDKILSVSQYTDGIGVATQGRQKNQVYANLNNPILWNALITFVKQIPLSGELPTADIEVR